MSFIRIILLLISIISNHNLDRINTIFYEARLKYYNGNYHLIFMPIDRLLNNVQVFVNDILIKHYVNIFNFQEIKFNNLKDGLNNINIKINEVNYWFQINLSKLIDITESSYFSLNQLIVDPSHTLELYDDEFIKIDQLIYEIKGRSDYIDFTQFGNVIYNDSYQLYSKCDFIIFNQNYFVDKKYNNGYHFSLTIKKTNNGNYFSLVEQKRLYLPLNKNDSVLDCQVIIENIFNSPISIYFYLLINVSPGYFSEKGDFQIVIED